MVENADRQKTENFHFSENFIQFFENCYYKNVIYL